MLQREIDIPHQGVLYALKLTAAARTAATRHALQRLPQAPPEEILQRGEVVVCVGVGAAQTSG
ncbi:MAG: hypothetical protein EA427_03685 [Spirochaetaceae bacterium]|nr:MAG: hypothetical protein EA427_03685 [Spirochaetaceae bacterium]